MNRGKPDAGRKPEQRVAEFRQRPLEERQAVLRRELGLIDEKAFQAIFEEEKDDERH